MHKINNNNYENRNIRNRKVPSTRKLLKLQSSNGIQIITILKPVVNNIFVFIAGVLFLCASCDKSNPSTTSSSVPNVAVSISININNSLYNGLTQVGGIIYLTGGYRGILLYRYNTGSVLAYDRTCTYDISDAGGIVQALNNGTATCLDCGSIYNLNNGSVNTGPSTIELKEYTTSFNSSTGALTITN